LPQTLRKLGEFRRILLEQFVELLAFSAGQSHQSIVFSDCRSSPRLEIFNAATDLSFRAAMKGGLGGGNARDDEGKLRLLRHAARPLFA
jgi:hypothetical protein